MVIIYLVLCIRTTYNNNFIRYYSNDRSCNSYSNRNSFSNSTGDNELVGFSPLKNKTKKKII